MSSHITSAKQLFNEVTASILLYEVNERHALAFRILEHLGLSRTEILTDKKITFTEVEKLSYLLEKINKAEPLQYVLGETQFYGRSFFVNHHVLIPRPETEELVDLICKENASHQGLKILDIGTGSGCIPISLSKELSEAKVYAIDIDEEALKVAKKNSEHHSASVNFFIHNILESAPFEIYDLDIIVSNPPYIRESEKHEMHSNVLDYEPHLALFVTDENPLLFYSSILNFAQTHLLSGGKCYFEINENLGKEMKEIMEKNNFTDVRIIKDINAKERFAYGKLRK